MQRIYLRHGDTLNLNNKTYTIISKIGDGATCAVYSAEYKDSKGYSYRVNIKECYPYNADIIRDEKSLVWNSVEEQMASINSFETAYEKLFSWQNENEIVSVFDICEANNTQYIIMESNKNCVTFDKDKPESLADILKTVRLLAHYIGKYHQNGYLHLDIKPSNFLVYPRPSEHIVLFDLDTVTAISDIETGKCKYASYSDGWAAPEQKQGKINKLCPATDIYAIGAVLFEKIMGRQVNNDDIGYFAEWKFEGEFFENINPKVKRLLTNIFKKTLAASIKRRYQNTDELVAALEKVLEATNEKMFLVSNCPVQKSLFVGRNSELTEIETAFSNGKKCVIIQGFMGMGKSFLALEYAARHREEYDSVCFSKIYDSLDEREVDPDLKIKTGLNRCVMNGGIQDETFDQRNSEFNKLVSEKTLIIIDNYDVEKITQYIDELLKLNCKIIITTRTVFRNLGTDFYSLQLSGMKQTELLKLFELESGKQYEETDKLFDFFNYQQMLTYSIVLGAGQIRESCLSLDEYLDDIYAQKNEEVVSFNNSEDQLLNHYRRTMRLHLLTDEQKEVLRTVFVMSYAINVNTVFVDSENGVFDRAVFKAYTGMNLNSLNSLIRSRIITEDDDGTLSLHPSINEIVKEDLSPTCQNCPHLYENICSRLDFVIYQRDGTEVEIYDTNGKFHYDEEIRIHELFDIYTWLYHTDPQKEKHLYNLFSILTIIDFDDCFLNFIDEKPIWHLDWDAKDYFITCLLESIRTEQYQALFADENYMGSCPNYGVKKRAYLSFIKISSSLIHYLSYPYYENYEVVFMLLWNVLSVVYRDLIDDIEKISSEDFEFIGDIIDAIEPIFENCCSIKKNGDYSLCIEEAEYYCVAEGYDYDFYPFTVGVQANYSHWTYWLYVAVNKILVTWILYAQTEEHNTQRLKSRKAWQREISVELYRIDKGFDNFFDFYYETPEFYCGKESKVVLSGVDVDLGFDENPKEYVSQIMLCLQKAKRPFYLYSLLLSEDFPLTDIAYDLLFDNNIGKIIANDNRLTDNQKTKLLKKALDEYVDSSDKFNDTDVKRLTSARKYHINAEQHLEETKDEKTSMELPNHILVLWYQVICELMPISKLSKQYMSNITKKIQKKYIESSCSFFDFDLYNEYNRVLIKDIPEFNNDLNKVLYELFNKLGHKTKCPESILAEAVYAFCNGKNSKYSKTQIKRANKHFIDSKGKRYISYDYDLLDLLLQR